MKRLPANLSAEDQRFYRRWVRGLFLFYVTAIAVALGITIVNDKPGELRASNETPIARPDTTIESKTFSAATGATRDR